MSSKLSDLLTRLLEEREQTRQDYIKNNLDNKTFVTSDEHSRLLNDAIVKETAKTCFSFNYPK